MTTIINGYVTDWNGADEVGFYLASADDEPVVVCLGENTSAEHARRWGLIDCDSAGEGLGVISTHATREAALAAAHVYLSHIKDSFFRRVGLRSDGRRLA
jgi:hypothetical protein